MTDTTDTGDIENPEISQTEVMTETVEGGADAVPQTHHEGNAAPGETNDEAAERATGII